MLRTIYGYSYIVVVVVVTYLKLLKIKKLPDTMSEQEKNKKIYEVPHWFGAGMIKTTGSKVTVIGRENIPTDRAVLFVGNHQSNFDIPLLMGELGIPHGYIAKVELENIPVISQWMKAMRCVFMDREDRRQSLQSIKNGIEILKNGQSLVVFPEGTRSKGQGMTEFKAGSLTLATKSGVPIVPITIDGSYKIYESNNNKVTPANVTLTISKPIYMEDVAELSGSELTILVESKVRENLAK